MNFVKLERGFSLLIVLIFLVMLGLIGFAVTHSAIVQDKISNNFHEKNLSFLAAEAALREAEVFLVTTDDLSVIVSSVSQVVTSPFPGVAKKAQFMISCVSAGCSAEADGKIYYRISAKGWGRKNNSLTDIESVVSIDE